MTMSLAANVLAAASVYGLIAVGYVIVYRATRVLNFAHGYIMTLSAYLFFTLAITLNGRVWVAVLLAVILTFVFGAVLYYAVLRSLTGRPVYVGILATLAVGFTVIGATILIWSPRAYYAYEFGLHNPLWDIPVAGVRMTMMRVVLIGAFILVPLLLGLWLRYARLGIQMRATAEDPELAALRGIPINWVFAVAWGTAAAIGGLAGMLFAANANLDPSIHLVALKALPAALVGGMDSIIGAVVGALVIALSEALAIQFINPLVSQVMPFALMLVMLMVRPWGLFGSSEHLERV